jgi:hypothetical protein
MAGSLNADTLLLRTEYEQPGHVLGTIPAGSIVNGNTLFSLLDSVLTMTQSVPDTFGRVRYDSLTVSNGSDTFAVVVADGYDYIVQQHDGAVLSGHGDTASRGEWAAHNNLWGDGTAVPDRDYRCAILLSDSLPEGCTFVWDTPGPASAFGGASVWCYTNMLYGNRYRTREDLADFPFKVHDLQELVLTFDYTAVFGDDRWKTALNMFFTDVDTLAPFSSNRGDFFMVFDQVGTWVPPYPDTLVGDTLILGAPCVMLYRTDSTGYEWRRVIVKDNARIERGAVDLLSLFRRFADQGFLDTSQSIANVQFGVEVTAGFGAVTVNSLGMTRAMKDPAGAASAPDGRHAAGASVRARSTGWYLSLPREQDVRFFSLAGRVSRAHRSFKEGVVGGSIPPGLHLLRVGDANGVPVVGGLRNTTERRARE